MTLSAGSSAAVNGTNDVVTAGANVQVSVAGTGNTINVNGTGDTLSANGAQINLAANTWTGNIAGNNNTISANAGATNVLVGVSGSGDTVNLNANSSSVVGLNGSNGVTVNASGDTVADNAGNTNTSVVGAGNTINVSGTGDTLNTSGSQVNLWANTLSGITGNNDAVVAEGGNVDASLVGNGNQITSSTAGNGFAIGGTSATLNLHGDGVTFEANSNGAVLGNANAIATAGGNVAVALVGNGDRVDSSIAGDGFSVQGTAATLNLYGDGVTFEANSNGAVNGNANAVAAAGANVDVALAGNGDRVDSSIAGDGFSVQGTAATLNLYGDGVTFEANSNGAVNGNSNAIAAAGGNVDVSLVGNGDRVDSAIGGNGFAVAGAGDVFNITGDGLTVVANSQAFVNGNSNAIAESSNDHVYVSGSNDSASGNSSDVTDYSGGTGDTTSGGTVSDNAPVSEPPSEPAPAEPPPTDVCPDGVDPILLNLQGGRVQTQGLNTSTARFDMQNNGQAVQTGWGTAGEGYLVYDPNDAGNTTAVTHDSQLVAGFGALQSLAQQTDGTGSGTLNASDALWSDLKVWVDTTGTGQYQSGQLYSLDQLGITGINLDAAHVNQDSQGNTLLDDSTFTWATGATGDIAGVDLRYYGASAAAMGQANTGADALVQAMASFAPAQMGIVSALDPALLQAQSPLLAAAH